MLTIPYLKTRCIKICKSFFYLVQKHKVISLLFVIFVIYPILSYTISFLSNHTYMQSDISVKLIFENNDEKVLFTKDKIIIHRMRPSGLLEELRKKNDTEYYMPPSFSKMIRFTFNEELYEKIDLLNLSIGKLIYSIKKSQFNEYFIIKNIGTYVTLETKHERFYEKSIISFFLETITYKGDLYLIGKPLLDSIFILSLLILIIIYIFLPQLFLKHKQYLFKKYKKVLKIFNYVLKIFNYELKIFNYELNISNFLPIIFFVLFLFIIIILSIFSPSFLMNDDIAIEVFIRSGNPAVFMSTTLGYFLSFLYAQVSDSIVWYAVYFYFFQVIILFLVFLIFSSVTNKFFCILLFYISFIFFYIYYLPNITFTIMGIMVGSVSLVYFAIILNQNKVTYIKSITIGLLFAHSFLFRTSALFAIVAFGLPFIIYFIIKNKNKKKFILLFFTPIILAFFSDNLINKVLVSEVHKDYLEFNALRGNLHGFPILNANIKNKKILNVNNWTENDYSMLRTWMFWDESKFNKETLKNIFKYSLNIKDRGISYITFQKSFDNIFSDYSDYFKIFFLIILFIYFFYSKKYLYLIIGYLAYNVGLMIYFDVFLRFPERIAIPLLFYLLFCLFYFISDSKKIIKTINKEISGYIFIAIFITTIFYGFTNSFPRLKNRSDKVKQNISLLQKVENRYSEKLLIERPGQGLPTIVNPFVYSKLHLNIINGGWPNFSPYFYSIINKHGLNSGKEIFTALIENENTIFVGTVKDAEYVKIYLNENFSGLHEFKLLDKIDTIEFYDFFKLQ